MHCLGLQVRNRVLKLANALYVVGVFFKKTLLFYVSYFEEGSFSHYEYIFLSFNDKGATWLMFWKYRRDKIYGAQLFVVCVCYPFYLSNYIICKK